MDIGGCRGIGIFFSILPQKMEIRPDLGVIHIVLFYKYYKSTYLICYKLVLLVIHCMLYISE